MIDHENQAVRSVRRKCNLYIILSVVLLAFIISAWHACRAYPVVSGTYVRISLKSSVSEGAKLYFDRGSGLNESDSRVITLTGDDQFHDYKFTLPHVPIRHLRFDPPDVGGARLVIRHLALTDSSEKLLQAINLGQLSPAHQIKCFALVDGQLFIVTEDRADDPQINIALPETVKPSLLSPPLLRFYTRTVLEFLILCGIIGMLVLSLRALHRRNPNIALSIEYWLNQSRIVPILFITLLCALLLPALWYSLTTPFALVDDYGMSSSIAWKHGGFSSWLKLTFLGDAGGRYRPLFELYNFLSWLLLGPHPALHHAARWLIQCASLYSIIKTLTIFTKNAGPESESIYGEKENRIDFFLPVLTAAYIFLLFPNQPAARLGPQEVNTVFFLTLANLSLARMLVSRLRDSQPEIKWGSIWMLIGSCIGLSMSKEVNVALLILFLASTAILFARSIISSRFFVAFGSLLFILLFTMVRVHAAAKIASYGYKPLSWDLLQANAIWIGKSIFQATTSLWLTFAFLGLLLFQFYVLLKSIQQNNIGSGERFFLFILYGEMLILFFAFSTSWAQVIRYWYPLVPILATLMAFGVKRILIHIKSIFPLNTVMRPGILFFLLFFAFVNYHYLLMQYAYQHNTRLVEKKMLDRVTERIRSGDKFVIHYDSSTPEIEMMAHAQFYFTGFLPIYFGIKIPIRTEPVTETDSGYFTITPTPLNTEGCLVETLKPDWNYRWLHWSSIVSGMLQGRPMAPFVADWGGVMENYRWYIYRAGCR